MTNKDIFKDMTYNSYAEGNAIKYICRHKKKGKKKDIEKAIHYLEMILERDYD
jgi:hypothetical protein